jgi:Ca2+/Na+ antiporter
MEIELTARIIISSIVGVIAIPLFIIAYRQHKEKRFIFTNKWLYASQKERENMDIRIKKAEYRVGSNVFGGLGILVLFLAFYFLLDISWLFYTGIVIMIILVIYAIYQWMTNERLEKLIENEKRIEG